MIIQIHMLLPKTWSIDFIIWIVRNENNEDSEVQKLWNICELMKYTTYSNNIDII